MDPRYKQMLDDVFDAYTMIASGAIVEIMHVQGNTTRWSLSGVELFGLSGEYIENGSMDWNDYVHPEDRKRYNEVMGRLVTGESQTYDLTYRVRTKTGEFINFRAVGSVLRGVDGKPSLIGGVLINEGITENTDPITVLPNRHAYLDELNRRIAAGSATFSLEIGIVRFEEITRMHGFTYGNRILQETGWMLREIIKERGEVFRGEGPKFILLCQGVNRDEIGAIYDEIRYRMQRGILVGGIRSVLTTSGGLIATEGSDVTADSIYDCLDYAYEESKVRGHGDLVDFNGSIIHENSHMIEMLNATRDALLDGCEGFEVIYNPVIAVKDGHWNGAESLLRWHNDRYGIVNAEEFLPVLERDFVFEELGDFLLETSLRDAMRFMEKDPDFLLCINVYRIQLESDYFIDNLFYLLKKTGFPSEQLSLKFTGDCRYIELNRMRSLVERLHEKKILVIIDGFGSGADSIVFLKNTDVDAVSMDTQFLQGITEEGRDREIFEYLVRMAATCVEHINISGVNDATLRDVILSTPVTTVQGACYSKPLTAAEMVERL